MTYEIVATASFAREYDAIIRYHVEELSAQLAAKRLMDDVENACGILAGNPTINAVSRKALLADLELREQLVRNYVIVYRIESNKVYLEHMYHQKQDFERLV